jgi:hypothetical protein
LIGGTALEYMDEPGVHDNEANLVPHYQWKHYAPPLFSVPYPTKSVRLGEKSGSGAFVPAEEDKPFAGQIPWGGLHLGLS